MLGITGLALQFFHVGKEAFRLLDSMRDLTGSAKTLKILIKVEMQR